MLYRVVPVLLLALGLILLGGATALADDTHEGKIVRAGEGKLTMVDKDGKNEHTHTVANDTKITLDGKDAKLTDLRKDMPVKVTTKTGDKKVVLKIEAKKAP